MRIFLLAVCLCLFAEGYCQQKKEFYNYYFKPTTGRGKYYVITEPKDGKWHRIAYYVPSGSEATEVDCIDENCKIKDGVEYWFYEDKKVKSEIEYKNGKKNGLAFHFNEDGVITDSANYVNDHVVGTKVEWYQKDIPEDSIKYDGNGNGYVVRYDKEGHKIAEGRVVEDDKEDGEWKHYYASGKTESVYQYAKGKIITSNCYDENGKPRTDGMCGESEAEFPSGEKAWNNFVGKNFDVNVPIRNNAPYGLYEVVVRFIIDKDGSVQDVQSLTNYGYGMEAEAERVIRKSPKWKPAMQNGRLVKAYREQPITFSIQKE